MLKTKVGILGCGFLASHIIPHLIPHTSHFFLIDRERIEKVNYSNSIFPKGLEGKRKVSGLAGLIQTLSSTPVTMIHKDVKKSEDLKKILKEYWFDFAICTFDNIAARLMVRQFALETDIPVLFVGCRYRMDTGK